MGASVVGQRCMDAPVALQERTDASVTLQRRTDAPVASVAVQRRVQKRLLCRRDIRVRILRCHRLELVDSTEGYKSY